MPVPGILDQTSVTTNVKLITYASECNTNSSAASCVSDSSTAQSSPSSYLLQNRSLFDPLVQQTVVSVSQDLADVILEAVSSGTLEVFEINIPPTECLKSKYVYSSLDEIFGLSRC